MKRYRKSSISIVLSLMMIFSINIFIPANVLAADSNFSGDGTEVNPFIISSAADLALLASLVNAGDTAYNASYYQMANDIDLSSYENWTPIGNLSNPFNGIFDGYNYTISGLTIIDTTNPPIYSCHGLFGYISRTIKNIKLSGVSITVFEGRSVGGLVGSAWNNESASDWSSISNCSVDGNISSIGSQLIGGIAGEVFNCTIENCQNHCSITLNNGDGVVGGIVGSSTDNKVGSLIICNCENTGVISLIDGHSVFTGGIAGINDEIIRNCSNTGEIGSSYSINNYGHRKGGIAGRNFGSINECYNSGSVSGPGFNGGIVGMNGDLLDNNLGLIQNCYNSGTIDGGSSSDPYGLGTIIGYTGGIAGQNQEILENCYNIGLVSGTGYIGGLAGGFDTSIYTNCYYLNSNSQGIGYILSGTDTTVSCTDSQMKDQSTFAGFDFDTIWTINSSSSYPYPQLQSLPVEDEPSTYTVTYDANGADIGLVPIDNNRYSAGDIVFVMDNFDTNQGIYKAGYNFFGWHFLDAGGNEISVGTSFTIGSNDVDLYATWVKNDTPYYEWKQDDQRWDDFTFGVSNLKMSDWGCAITSVAILVAHSLLKDENEIDPRLMCDYLNKHDGFSGDSIIWNAVTEDVNETRDAQEFNWSNIIPLEGTKDEKLATILSYYNQGYYIVVNVTYGYGTNYAQSHFVAVRDVSETAVTMMDPLTTSTDMFTTYQTDGISRIILYSAPISAKSVSVIFDSMGGSDIDPDILRSNSLLDEPNPPVREGYIFEGWYKNREYETPWNFEEDLVTDNITLYAKWSSIYHCDILQVISPENAIISDSNITAYIPAIQKSVDIDFVVSPGAIWQVYSSIKLKKAISPTISFKGKASEISVYIKVTAGDGVDYKIYTMTITKE